MGWVKIDFWQLLESAVQRFQTKATQRQISIRLQGKPAQIQGIPSVLQEVVDNLLDNAIKYNHDQGSVTLDLSQNDQDVVFRIQDTGIGIAQNEQERVFERFYRTEQSHAAAIEGTGLGLAIVKHGVLLHHAKLELHSSEGEGTTFIIRFPKSV